MIKILDNVISKSTLGQCNVWLEKANWTYGWHSDPNVPYGHWNVDITKTTMHNPTDVTKKLPKEFKDVWDKLNVEYFKGQGLLTRCYANRHTFGTEGYIHTDSQRKEDHTVIVYLNEEWDYGWGGETMFYENGEVLKGVTPRFGRMVVFPGYIEHCAKGLSRICSKVRTTLMFKVTVDPKAIYESEVLLSEFLNEVKANEKPHKVGSLKDHLLRVFHILKGNGANDILALAGGLHSVYSTGSYRIACLPYTSENILETFGPEVDRIVKLFSTTDRPKALETPDGTLNEVDLFLLRCIECANLYDQEELNETDYPNLYKFSLEIRTQG
jgi:SM-20-related protein